jgi:putative two-component system response regulator
MSTDSAVEERLMSKRGLEHLIPIELDFQCECANIWVVDDEPLITRFVKCTLSRSGFKNVECFQDGNEVLELLDHRHPDLIVLDIEMPSKNGLELLQEIRSNPDHSEISIIILSGTDKATKYRSLKLGAVDFIDKPVDGDELEIRIRKALRVI